MTDLHDPELEELDLALQSLRQEIQARFPAGTQVQAPWGEVGWASR